jgi:signal transduction histidine kinase
MQVFTSVLVLGIFFAVFVITDIRSFKDRKVESMLSLAQVLGNNNISTLQFQDNEEARKTLAELKNVAPEINHAGILDKNGVLFARYDKKGTGTFRIPVLLQTRSSVFTEDRLYVSYEIVNENESLGKVILEVELGELHDIKKSRFKMAGILLIVALLFSFLVAMAVQSYISRRLLYLVNSMKEVGATGDYNKTLPDSGKDEISVLIRVFNNLLLQVKENQRRKDEFIDIASHELKTPLTSIKGYLDLLSMIEEEQPNKQFVQKALINVNKLESLIKDLLDVSKIQSGQLNLSMKTFNLDNLVDETIAAIQMVSGTHQVIRKGGFNDEVVLADRLRIEQVLTNLLSNAIKYSPGENKVIVSSIRTDKELIIQVRDFGIGVPPEEQGNIFERFYRSRDISNTISGFGLGLYICRDIIKRHKGRIWVEPEEKGSSFYFSLPLQQDPPPEQ